MKYYIQIILLAIAVALIDYTLKDYNITWNELPGLFQGWSWHLLMGGLYGCLILLLVYKTGKVDLLIGLIGIINEDALYYAFKALDEGSLYYNDWLFKSPELYVATLLWANIMMVGYIRMKVD